jgi:hypothetical protein
MNIKLKSLIDKRKLSENNFEPGVSGGSGALNYTSQFTATPAGGNTTQSPDHFSTSGKSTNHMNSEQSSSAMQNLPDRQSSSGGVIHPGSMQDKTGFEDSAPIGTTEKPHVLPNDSEGMEDNPERDETPVHPNAPKSKLSISSPAAKSDQEKANTTLNPDQSYNKDVDIMFQKKQTPSPDEIMSALQYELGQMVKKDKAIAKRMVLKNLKDDPHYYSKLDMLNIDDKKMKVSETQLAKTIAVLDEMIAAKQKKRIDPPPYMEEILSDLRYKRFGNKQS